MLYEHIWYFVLIFIHRIYWQRKKLVHLIYKSGFNFQEIQGVTSFIFWASIKLNNNLVFIWFILNNLMTVSFLFFYFYYFQFQYRICDWIIYTCMNFYFSRSKTILLRLCFKPSLLKLFIFIIHKNTKFIFYITKQLIIKKYYNYNNYI